MTNEHTVKSYEEELQHLIDSVIKMGSLTESQMVDSMDAVIKVDKDSIDKIIKSDDDINKLDLIKNGIIDGSLDLFEKNSISIGKELSFNLNLNLGDKIMITFQSRFGPKAWLKPYTDKTLEKLAENGTKNIVVMMPGFSADCLETLEEISIEAREAFIEAGGVNFSTVPCLNDERNHTNFLTNLIKERLLIGWL